MMNFKPVILLFVFAIVPICVTIAQDSILFISGRVLVGKVVLVDSMDVQVEVKKRKNKTKLIYAPKSDIFAIKYGDSRTEIYYEPINAEEYSVREMELFVKGEQDALRNTKAPLLFAGGILIGGVFVTWIGPFYGLLPLLPYSLLSGSFTNKVKEKGNSDPTLLREDAYVTGYVTKAKNIKIQKAITGSIVGWVSGLVAIAINNQMD